MKTDMRVYLAALLLVLSLVVIANGQSALQEMVKTEQAFSKMAEEQNTRDAFLAFIADDGLLFRPGAVNGKKWMLEHPAPPSTSDKRPLLAWQPAYAVMAASGDMGFTTGPWEAKADVNDEKPQGYGHFMTVWKKQADGTWKFVVDLGISHPQSGGPLTLWTPAETPKKEFKPVDVPIARETLLERDRNYAAAVLSHGFAKSYAAYAAREVRLYRANYLPFIGREASIEQLSQTTGEFKWTPIGGDVSSAGDLGYTHGTYEAANEHGSYVRIWKKKNGLWRIVMDVTNQH
jgi:ketosteroid isomerase-like protein